MQAQLTVYGQSREMAISYVEQALKNFCISGVTTNINFLASLIKTEAFKNGEFHTQFLSKERTEQICSTSKLQDLQPQSNLTFEELGVVAATIIQKLQAQQPATTNNASGAINNWKAQQWK